MRTAVPTAGPSIDRATNSNEGGSGRPAGTIRHWSSRVEHCVAAAWIFLLTAAVLTPALARGPMIGPYDLLNSSGLSSQAGVVVHGNYGSSDIIATNIPWSILNWTQVHHGTLPLWNPYNGLGLPLAFNWQSASFGLPSLVSYLVPLRLAVTAGVIVTLLTAGSGAYVLGRTLRLGLVGSLMVATVFELSGPLVAWLGYPLAQVTSWGGWMFAAGVLVLREGHRAASIALFAVVTAYAIYAGHPESLIAMEIALGAFLLAMLGYRALPGFDRGPICRPALDLAIGTVAGCALGGPLLLPALQLTSTSVRSAATAGSTPPVHELLYTVFSGFDGMTVMGNFGFNGSYFYSETAAYVGSIAVALSVVGLVVAVRSRRPEFLAMGVVVIVTAALAYWSPVDHLVEHIPKIGNVAWLRALMPLSLGLAALGGVGVDMVAKSASMPTVLRRWFAGIFGVAALLMVLLWTFGRNGALPTFARAVFVHIRTESFFWPGVGLAVGLVGGLLVLWRPATGRLVAVSLLGFESIFLVTSGAVQIGSSTQGIVATPAITALKTSVGSAVVGFGPGTVAAGCGLGVVPDVNIALQLHELSLYDPIVPKSYFTTWRQMTDSEAGSVEFNLFCPPIRTVSEARDLGVQYVIEQSGDPGPRGSVFVKSIKVPNPHPPNPKPPDEDLYRIPDTAPVTLTSLDGGAGRPTSPKPSVGLIRSDSNPAHWSIVSHSSTAGLLQLHLTNVPGWSATIDGRALPLEGSSVFLFRAKIPPGRHVIELHYWPMAFTVGIAAAILAVGSLAAWIFFEERKRHLRLRRHSASTG
jgi:Bacterial membrane protein YfhO